MKEFVQAAIDAGFRAYGISSHSPLPFPAACAMRAERVEEYIAEIQQLKRERANRIELYAGMEIDYINDDFGPANDYFQALPLDYRIGAIHYVVHPATGQLMDVDGPRERFANALDSLFQGDIHAVIDAYYDASHRMIARGGFDFIAHPDKIAMNAERVAPGVTRTPHYRDRLEAYLEEIAARRLMIEINTKAYHSLGALFPHQEHLQRLRELRVPVIVNSDAHYPHAVNDGRPEAINLLKAAGFRHLTCLSKGEWITVDIDR